MGAIDLLNDRLDCAEADIVFLFQEIAELRKKNNLPPIEHWKRNDALKKTLGDIKGTSSCYQEKKPKRARSYAI